MSLVPVPPRQVLALACGALLLCAGAARAQQVPAAPAAPAEAARRQASAARIEGRAPTVDGRLDEAVWQEAAAPVHRTSRSRQPDEGKPRQRAHRGSLPVRRRARCTWARACTSPDPARIQAPVTRRDDGRRRPSTCVVSLDTYLDRRTAYTFGVTAVRRAAGLVPRPRTDETVRGDASFDPVWAAPGRSVDSAGVDGGDAHPLLSQLRFNDLAAQTSGGSTCDRCIPSRERGRLLGDGPARRTGVGLALRRPGRASAGDAPGAPHRS